MLLSFSIPSMRPMLLAGLHQRLGDDVGVERTKRQTIRALGGNRPRARNRLLLERAQASGSWALGYDLQLWWKSRTKERSLIGEVVDGSPTPIRLYPITIMQRTADMARHDGFAIIVKTMVPGFESRAASEVTITWEYRLRPPNAPEELCKLAWDDGFDDAYAFADFFVPNVGDRFDGVLIKW